MKTELFTNPITKSEGPMFPLLAQSLHQDPRQSFTVLFFNYNSGVVVHRESDAGWEVGCISRQFTACTDRVHWRILTPGEKVILQNND